MTAGARTRPGGGFPGRWPSAADLRGVPLLDAWLEAPLRARTLLLPLGVIAYVLWLRWAYIHVVSPAFSYFGMTYHPLPAGWELSFTIVLTVLSLSMMKRPDQPTRIIQWFLFLLVVVPNAFVPFYILGYTGYPQLFGYLACIVAGYLLIEAVHHLPTPRLPALRIPPSVYWGGLLFVTLGLEAVLLARFHGAVNLVGLTDVYGQRTLFREMATEGWVRYLVNFLGYATNPMLMAYGLVRRRYRWFVAGALGEVALYAIGAWKTYLFFVAFIPLMWVLLRSRSSVGLKLVWSTVGVFLLLFLFHSLGRSALEYLLTAFLMVRVFCNAGLISAEFVSFFVRNPFTHFSHVRGFSHLADYPYSQPVIDLVGRYWTGHESVANGHLWADGFAAWGLPGMLIVSLLAAGVLWLINCVSRGKDRRLVTLVLCADGLSLANASLFTWLLTHGVAVTLLLLYLLPGDPRAGEAAGGPRVQGESHPQ